MNKQIKVAFDDITRGDMVVGVEDNAPFRPPLIVKSKNFGSKYEHIYGDNEIGLDHARAPLGTMWRVTRPMSPEEERAEHEKRAAHAIEQIKKAALDPNAALTAVKERFCEQIMKASRPANELSWRADELAAAEANAALWARVRQAALAHAQHVVDVDELSVIDWMVGVIAVAKDTEHELLTFYASRSTNPYANALDDDMRQTQSKWLRDHRVMHVRATAETLNVTLPANWRQ